MQIFSKYFYNMDQQKYLNLFFNGYVQLVPKILYASIDSATADCFQLLPKYKLKVKLKRRKHPFFLIWNSSYVFLFFLQNSALCEYDLITRFFCSLQLPFYLPLWPKVDLLFYWRGWYFVEIRKISLKFELNYPTQLSRMHGLVRKITPILPTRANPTLLPPPAKPPKIVSSRQLLSQPPKSGSSQVFKKSDQVTK